MGLTSRPLRIALIRHGESGSDVDDRVSSFLETMHRDFETLRNPDNAETRVLLRQPDFRCKLDRPFEQWTEYEPTERERSAWL